MTTHDTILSVWESTCDYGEGEGDGEVCRRNQGKGEGWVFWVIIRVRS